MIEYLYQKRGRQAFLSGLTVAFLIFFGACGHIDAGKNGGLTARNPNAPGILCGDADVVEIDGRRRLALIVGVGEYRNDRIPDLPGPPNDARRFYDMLTGKNGYGFPRENVCMLLDEKATTAGFRAAFDTMLVSRARENDVAVVFYAGHGSQARDKNGDEPDEWDETFLFHDARTDGIGDMLDDEMNQMLARLYRKTRNITVILDACNSGTATRAPDKGTTLARFFTPMPEDLKNPAAEGEGGDGSEGWTTEAMPGLVVFSAATDSNPALEKNGKGIFTDALLQVMSGVGDQPMTYAQIARQVPALVAAESPQIPYFQGDLTQKALGNTGRTHPVAWEVSAIGPPLTLTGPPLPGIGKGAEMRIYDGRVEGADTRDPGKAKATVVVTEMTGLNASALVSATAESLGAVAPGDLAVLVRPADDYTTLKVRLKPGSEVGGIPSEIALKIRALVAENPETRMLVQLVEGAGDFELGMIDEGRLVLRGPENRPRNFYRNPDEIPKSLWQHARQKALLHLRGEGGSDFVDNRTLAVSLVPAPSARQNKCADGIWRQAAPGDHQMIPLCQAWNVKVTLSKASPVPLLIGALILSTDGGIFALPRDDRKVRLQPGESTVFNATGETFIGLPPLDVRDRIMVFGTWESNPVSWGQFTETAAGRGPGMSGLARALDRYFQPGTRGVGVVSAESAETTTWTLSTITLHVEANNRFAETDRGTRTINWREYTIADFDIRPYLPADEMTALYKVLKTADRLANASARDGYSYRQHDWTQPSDEANLKRGIDCSRAVWFAFTRSGIPYNREDRYLTTAMMVGDDSIMDDDFDSCAGDPDLEIGDILVYRDETRGDGHAVMVIDPEKRIAWGSHGWDGNSRNLPVEPDTGVEYQKIKFKPDWERWDRGSMKLKACWRHRRIAGEGVRFRGRPGSRPLTDICNAERNCGR